MWIPVDEELAAERAALRRAAGPEQGRDRGASTARSRSKIWRRSYDIPPPPLTPDDERHPVARSALRALDPTELPLTESLKDTVARFLPYWHETIAPAIESGQRVLIAAHGNSLRALVKYLDNISEEDIVELNIPTGIPLVYELDDELRPIRHYYLGDPAAAAAARARRDRRRKAAATKYKKADPLARIGPTFLSDCLAAERPADYSTGSAVSSAAIRSERRKRRSLAVTSNVRRCCTSRTGRAGVVTFASAAVCERFTKPTTASSVTFISNPAARAFSRHASTCGFSATAAAIASASSRANRLTTSSILVPSLRRRAGFRRRFPVRSAYTKAVHRDRAPLNRVLSELVCR